MKTSFTATGVLRNVFALLLLIILLGSCEKVVIETGDEEDKTVAEKADDADGEDDGDDGAGGPDVPGSLADSIFRQRTDPRHYTSVRAMLDSLAYLCMNGDNDYSYEPYKYTVYVKARVIGSTQRTMNNATYAPPFAGKTAWVVADDVPADGFQLTFDYDHYFLPVRIADTQTYKRDFNLPDNPRYWHRTVYICGALQPYMSRPGIYHVLSILEEDEMAH